jgi:hypothetical protein
MQDQKITNIVINTILSIFGFAIAIFACYLLNIVWELWSSGPWSDPCYIFGAKWYPEPPSPFAAIRFWNNPVCENAFHLVAQETASSVGR